MLTVVLSFIIIFGSIQSDQVRVIPENSSSPLSKTDSRPLQENTGYKFAGAEKCASVCHNNETMGFQFNLWNNSLHKNAYKTLDSKKAGKYAKKARLTASPQESRVCLKCHVTGGELDASYFTATYKKEQGVTCEACHKHIGDGKTYLPGEADCLQCHNDSLHKIRKFNFREECAKIAHPRPTVMKSTEPSTGQPL